MISTTAVLVSCQCGTLPLDAAIHRDATAAWTAASAHVALTGCRPAQVSMTRRLVPAGIFA